MTQYEQEPLDIGQRMDLVGQIADARNRFYSVTPDDYGHDYPVLYADGEMAAYKVTLDLNTLAMVIEEAKKPYSTGESIRAILGIEADPIKFHYVSESVYVSTDDDDNYERGEN